MVGDFPQYNHHDISVFVVQIIFETRAYLNISIWIHQLQSTVIPANS